MNKAEAEQILADTLTPYRAIPYQQLVVYAGSEVVHVTTRGRSGVQYQIDIQIFWDDPDKKTIRVMGSIDDGGLRAFLPISSDFIVTADGRVL
jgi:hypothetical protein